MAGCPGCYVVGGGWCLLALLWPTHVVGRGRGRTPALSMGGSVGRGCPSPEHMDMHVPFWSACLHLEVLGCGSPSCWDLPPLLNPRTHEGFLARYILTEGTLGLCRGCCCGLHGDGRKQNPGAPEWSGVGEPLLVGWVPLSCHVPGLLWSKLSRLVCVFGGWSQVGRRCLWSMHRRAGIGLDTPFTSMLPLAM